MADYSASNHRAQQGLGVTYKTGDIGDLSLKIKKIIDNDEYREKVVENSLLAIKKYYSYDQFLKSLLTCSGSYHQKIKYVKKLINKIKNKTATVGIIGLGYVGLPLAIKFAEAGYNVIGLDNDESKVRSLNSGKSYINHIKDNKIRKILKKYFFASYDFSEVSNLDAIILCLPTPLNKKKEPDLSYITNTLNSIYKYFKKGQLLSLESTSYPGTTEEVILPYLEKNGFRVGVDFFLIYSPEREDPGNKKFQIENIPKIVSGYSNKCVNVGCYFYQQIVNATVPVDSIKTAELAKLFENIYRSVNIGLANEMKIIADKMGIDIINVINAAATKPFGFKPFYPGPGIGGHCIPIDPFYLSWKAKRYNVDAKFIELAGKINSSIPSWVVGKINNSLKKKKKLISKLKILIVGIAYKENIDDLRESIAHNHQLLQKRSKVDYFDPYINKIPITRKYKFNMKSIKLNKSSISIMMQ